MPSPSWTSTRVDVRLWTSLSCTQGRLDSALRESNLHWNCLSSLQQDQLERSLSMLSAIKSTEICFVGIWINNQLKLVRKNTKPTHRRDASDTRHVHSWRIEKNLWNASTSLAAELKLLLGHQRNKLDWQNVNTIYIPPEARCLSPNALAMNRSQRNMCARLNGMEFQQFIRYAIKRLRAGNNVCLAFPFASPNLRFGKVAENVRRNHKWICSLFVLCRICLPKNNWIRKSPEDGKGFCFFVASFFGSTHCCTNNGDGKRVTESHFVSSVEKRVGKGVDDIT